MPTPLAVRAFEHWAFQYSRTWRGSIVSGVLSPVLFLAAMGLGLGSLVDSSTTGQARALGAGDYLTFLAPGLLAASAMQVAVGEATYPVMAAIKWIRTYHGMLATPLRVVDVMAGHLAWVVVRIAITATVFTAVMTAFGASAGPQVLLALPAAVLTGAAFAMPVAAFAAVQDNDVGFSALFRFGVVPLFLFSGTFFPVTQLPRALELVAYATPLWQGVDLCRSLALGTAGVGLTAVHLAYLLAMAAGGAWLARRAYESRLRT